MIHHYENKIQYDGKDDTRINHSMLIALDWNALMRQNALKNEEQINAQEWRLTQLMPKWATTDANRQFAFQSEIFTESCLWRCLYRSMMFSVYYSCLLCVLPYEFYRGFWVVCCEWRISW
jgi:hypothetical protein